MKVQIHRFLITFSLVFILSPSVRAGETHTSVIVETVNKYAPCYQGNTQVNLGHSNQSGNNFVTTLLGSAVWPLVPNLAGFQLTVRWQDPEVFDTDFLDPDIAGSNPRDDDTHGFDQPNTAISFFQGHGLQITKPTPDQVCSIVANCTNPVFGTSGPGLCIHSPGSAAKYGAGKGVCQYTSTRAMLTCGAGDANGDVAALSPYMAFGENPTVGGWRGAGTDGGTSLAIVKMSFGMITFFPDEWSSIFAGLHLYEGVMVSWGELGRLGRIWRRCRIRICGKSVGQRNTKLRQRDQQHNGGRRLLQPRRHQLERRVQRVRLPYGHDLVEQRRWRQVDFQ